MSVIGLTKNKSHRFQNLRENHISIRKLKERNYLHRQLKGYCD